MMDEETIQSGVAAIRTLQAMGYTHKPGAPYWKPPLGFPSHWRLDPTSTEWAETVAIGNAIYGEMCAINETPAKDQTPQQKERLEKLRQECVELHHKRILLNQLRPGQGRSAA